MVNIGHHGAVEVTMARSSLSLPNRPCPSRFHTHIGQRGLRESRSGAEPSHQTHLFMERGFKQNAHNLCFVGNLSIYFTSIKITTHQSVGDWGSSGVRTGGAGWFETVCLNTPHKEGLGSLPSPTPRKPDTHEMKLEVSGF